MRIILLLLMLSLSFITHAVYQDRGFYGLIGIGRGYTHFNNTSFSPSPEYHSNDWVYAGRVALGFNIDNYIGIEAGSRFFNPRKIANVANIALNGTVKQQAYTLQTVINWPLTRSLDVFAKFGPAYVSIKRNIEASSGQIAAAGLQTDRIKQWEPVYGVGLALRLTAGAGPSLFAEYSTIQEDKDKKLPKSELYMLGAIFKF